MSQAFRNFAFNLEEGVPCEPRYITSDDVISIKGMPDGLYFEADSIEGTPEESGDFVTMINTTTEKIVIEFSIEEARQPKKKQKEVLSLPLYEEPLVFHFGDVVHIPLTDNENAMVASTKLPKGFYIDYDTKALSGKAEEIGSSSVFISIVDPTHPTEPNQNKNFKITVEAITLESLHQVLASADEYLKKRDKYLNIDILEKAVNAGKTVTLINVDELKQEQINEAVENIKGAINLLEKINTPPVITFKKEQIHVIQGKEVLQEELLVGVEAFDEDDGDLTSEIQILDTVDTDVLGEQDVRYSVTDSGGLSVIKSRKVLVIEDETKKFKVVGRPIVYVEEPLELGKYIQGNLNLEVSGDEEVFDAINYEFLIPGEHTIHLSNGFKTIDLRVKVLESPKFLYEYPRDGSMYTVPLNTPLSEVKKYLNIRVEDHEGRLLEYNLVGFYDKSEAGVYNLEVIIPRSSAYTTIPIQVNGEEEVVNGDIQEEEATAEFLEEDNPEVNEEVVNTTTEESDGPIVINTLEDLQNVVSDSNISIQGPAAHETLKQEILKSVLNPTQEEPVEPEIPQETEKPESSRYELSVLGTSRRRRRRR
jgi:hypothetical protein